MLKISIFASTMAVLLATSLSMPSEAAKPKKVKSNQQQQQQQELQAQQGSFDNGGSAKNDSYGGSAASSSSSGGSDSISMFKAGNTSLPAGTYAMTNVSTGAAFVVIVDDSGDMRAQDARAMNLIDDKNSSHTAKNNRKNSGGNSRSGGDYNDYDNSGNNYSSSNNYGSSNNDNSGSYRSGNSSGNLGPNGLLPPQQTPASAILPTPNSNSHPLLQGASPGSVYQPPQPSGAGGLLPSLFTSQNPLAQQNPLAPGQPAPGGIQGKIQAELQRQLNKQLMKYGGSGNLEQQVRKMINKF